MIGIPELALLGLASYRATQMAVHDSLFDPARDRLFTWHSQRPESAPRGLIVTLASCVYCMGWWLSGALLTVYLLVTGQFEDAPLLTHGLEWLAIAGAGVLLNRIDDSLGDGK